MNNALEIIKEKAFFYNPLISKYDKILSIGSTCFVKKFMLSIGINQETEYFDYINTPNMSILLALEITISIPFIMKSIKYNNYYYCDGGLLVNFPLYYFNINNFYR